MSPPYRPYANKPHPTARQVIENSNMRGKLTNKTILITGCTSGIGVETARALYETGAKLFLTGRDTPKLQTVIDDIVSKSSFEGAVRPEGLEMHLDSLDSVRKGAKEFLERSEGKCDVLVCNAGVAATKYGETEDGFETNFGVNHLSHHLLFTLLHPALLSSAKHSNSTSRVIILSSGGHKMSDIIYPNPTNPFTAESYHKFLAYAQSKTANILMITYIHNTFSPSQPLVALAVHPGEVSSNLYRDMTTEDWNMVPGGREEFERGMLSVEQGAATTVWAVGSERFEDVERGGQFLSAVGEGWVYRGEEVEVEGYAVDGANAERLWKLSREAVGVRDE